MEKEKDDANLKRAQFHEEIYLNDVDSVVEHFTIDKARKELSEILAKGSNISVNRKDYYVKLYELFKEAKWEHLNLSDKVHFFKNWFTAVSDKYITAFHVFKLLKPTFTGYAYYLHTFQHDEKKFTDYFGVTKKEIDSKLKARCNKVFWDDLSKELQFFYVLSLKVFDIHLDETGRNNDLQLVFKENLRKGDSYTITTKPAWIPSKFPSEKELLKLRHQVGVIPIFINVKYEENTILSKVKELIKYEQECFFSQCPEKKGIYIKRDLTGRKDTHQFDEWARYLEVFMLREQGKLLKQIADDFYDKNSDQIRQVSRDQKKAQNLSNNAIQGNFPGKY